MGQNNFPARHVQQHRNAKSSNSSIGLIRALNLLIPDTGPGGYFGHGSVEATLDRNTQGCVLINKIARAQTRAWLEAEWGSEFGLKRKGLKPSLQVEMKPGRPLPCTSIKWNSVTSGITHPLRIEEATIRYLNRTSLGWGNNRSPDNNYTTESTLSRGFVTPFKTVYFDHLSGNVKVPTADEAFTGVAPGSGDIDAWVYLARNGIVKPGMIVNFQNELGQSISEDNCSSLVRAGYQVSVVPHPWWAPFLYLSKMKTEPL